MTWYLYILQCEDASLYTGIALNVQQRLARHQAGKGSKYVRSKGQVTLVHMEPHKTKSAALRREREIKSWSRRKKMALIYGPERP
ncbi:MAG: GIY-YIG nuclease family protein [Candidatus Omnitrophica bacterium]|nr:GIY-YIG nuclease family protein [Candidatus Omnitrophota bacterium]